MRLLISIFLIICYANYSYCQNIERIVKKGERKIYIVKSKKATQDKKNKALTEVYNLYKELIHKDSYAIKHNLILT